MKNNKGGALIKMILIVSLILLFIYAFADIRRENQTPEIDERCLLQPDPGRCRAYIPRYFFNQSTDLCEEFIWGGCEGTVPFEVLEECQSVCEK